MNLADLLRNKRMVQFVELTRELRSDLNQLVREGHSIVVEQIEEADRSVHYRAHHNVMTCKGCKPQ